MKIKVLILFGMLFSCSKSDINPDAIEANPDWTSESHSNDASPNYALVFDQNKVNKLEITIGKTSWEAIKADMSAKNKGTFGQGGGQGGPGLPGGGENPPGGGIPPGGGGVPDFGEEPAYVEVDLKFNEKAYKHVGFRLKGNSTLSSTWKSGIYKLPFRLKMDEYEDKYPEIKNQRLYGFKDLTFSAGVKDNSLIREKVTADIFRLAGIPAAQTAFYRLYIDFGEGQKYCGIYTMVEAIDDTMLASQFGEEKGNLYKPESNFQSFTATAFPKKNNEEAADYSDVQGFVSALNATNRTASPAVWRANLEKVIDMDHCIKWLAVNSTLVNWDTYGVMAHNHYFYGHSTRGLVWIPWDNNEALASNNRAINLDLLNAGNTWPLLKYVAADADYYAKYKNYVRQFNAEVFTEEKMANILTKANALISPYVNGSEKEVAPYTNITNMANFTSSLAQLKSHVASRNAAVKALK